MKSSKYFSIFISIILFLICSILTPVNANAAGLYAKYAVLFDADSGRILFGNNENTAVSMASTTKIMTLIIALENCDKNFVATTSTYAASMPDVQLNAVTGEQFIINDLFYSLMLESHNDSAVIIAENAAYYLLCKNPSLRSETPFINNYNYDSSFLSEINHEQSKILVHIFTDLMNEKADDILLADTYYITPNGLDDEDNYSFHHTTAYDLAKTMAYCINNEDFLYITQTVSKTFSDTTGRYHYQLNNKNRLLNPDEGIISGKTGFTNKAGYCYVCAYKDKNRTLCIALLACGWPPNKNYKWSDANYLIALGKKYYKERYFNYQFVFYVPVTNGKRNYCRLIPDRYVEFLTCGDDSVTYEINLPETLPAPVNSEQIYGSINLYINNIFYDSIYLKAEQSIIKQSYFQIKFKKYINSSIIYHIFV